MNILKKLFGSDKERPTSKQQPGRQTKKQGSQTLTYCHICGATKGPFLRENFPPGVTDHPSFVRCQACVRKGPGFKLDPYIGQISNPRRHLYECSGCGALLFCHVPRIPDAYAQFERKSCPQCGALLPTGDEIEFRVSEEDWEQVEKSSMKETLEEIRPLYERLASSITDHPNLSKIVSNTMIVKTPPWKSSFSDKEYPLAYHVWVVHHHVDIDQSEAIPFLLQKLVHGALSFASSQRLDAALQKEGLEIVEQTK